jgi:CBS domain-containing protein
MQCGDIMTREVISVSPSDSIGAAAHLMLEHRISGLPVIDAEGALVGMISEGDLLKRTETGTEQSVSALRALWLGPQRLAERYIQTHGRSVRHIMTPDPVSARESSSLSEIVALMQSRNIKRLPVLRDGRVVGIVARADLLRALAQLLPPESGAAASDAAIRSAILRELQQQRWAQRQLIALKVHDGIVELQGFVANPAERQALRVLIQNTAGVKQLIDELLWVEPVTDMAFHA